MKPYTISNADIETPYRYSLTAEIHGGGTGTLIVIQCNPSKADNERSDATVGKVANWAAEHNYGKVIFLNLYALISSDPQALTKATDRIEMIGPRNNRAIADAIADKEATLVFAWGDDPRRVLGQAEHYERVRKIWEIITVFGNLARVYQVGKATNKGNPRHGRSWNKPNRDLIKIRPPVE